MKRPPDLLIGHSGTVGSTLLRQRDFSSRVRRADLHTIEGKTFGTVVCAGAPGMKWLANQEPAADRANLDALSAALSTIRCTRFVLISTVDVYPRAAGQTEQRPPEAGATPYGTHRLDLERFVQSQFPHPLIARLPGLVGPGLRKNALYDLLNSNTAALDPRASFQFYPLVNLWADLQRLLSAGVTLAHLTAAPLSLAHIARDAFNVHLKLQEGQENAPPVHYDLHSSLAPLWDRSGPYLYAAHDAMTAIRAYAQSGGAVRT